MVKRRFIIIGLLLLAAFVGAQQTWDGLAVVARFGSFPADGLYAATNVVEPNSVIEVRNLETGDTARLIVASEASQPGVLLVVSSQAAERLGMDATGSTTVRVRQVAQSVVPDVEPEDERALHQDPDFNPLAFSGDSTIDVPPGVEPEPEAEPEPQPEPEPEAEPEPDVPPEPEAEPERPEASPAVREPSISADEASLATRIPEAQPQPEAATEPEPEPELEPEPERPETPLITREPAVPTDTSPLAPSAEPAAAEPVAAAEPSAVTEADPEVEQPPAAPPDKPRRGIAAGVSSAAVGRAREDVERPEAPMVAPVRTADRAVAPRPSEPVPPAPAPGPTADLERAPAPQERAPRVAASALPVPPEEEEPVATEPDAPAVGVQPSFGTPSQIQSALESVMTRLPQKELSAPPIERAGMGFIDAPERPGRDGIGELRIAEVTPPAVEIPSFGGIGMLRSDQPDDVTIAEAVPPAPDAPEVVERQSPPAERPDGSEIAQAAPPAADLPEGPGLERAEPATEPFAPSLAGAAPRDEDVRPDEAVEPPVVPVVRVRPGRLPTAQLEPESRPELADVPRASPPAEDPVELTGGIPGAPTGPRDSLDRTAAPELESKYDLVDAQPVSPERPEADLAAPEAEEPDLLLTLEPADFRPPEEEPPDAVALERAEAPGEEPVRTAATEPEAPAGPEASATPRREPDVREEPLVAHSVPEPAEVEPEREAVTEPAEVAATEAPVTPTTPAGLPIVPDLADDSFYLQIGAYNTAEAARDAVAALSSTYPLAVVSSTEMGRAAYRVLVGPLAEDETGTTLYWLRAKGYRDSFVRRGNEL